MASFAMRRRRGTCALAVALAAVAASAQNGATEPPSPMVKALKAAGVTASDTGAFLTAQYTITDKNRRQTVYIRKAGMEYLSLKVFEVFSICYDSPKAPSAEFVAAAFQRRLSAGGLVYEKPSETQKNWRIRFRMEATVTMPPAKLAELLQVVAATGDTLEREYQPDQEDRL